MNYLKNQETVKVKNEQYPVQDDPFKDNIRDIFLHATNHAENANYKLLDILNFLRGDKPPEKTNNEVNSMREQARYLENETSLTDSLADAIMRELGISNIG